MRRFFACAVVLGAIGGCSSFKEAGVADAGPATDPDGGADVVSDAAPPDAARPDADASIVDGIPPGGKLVFVSTTLSHPPVFSGNFVAYADGVCKSEASDAKRPGEYVAWLATPTQNAFNRLTSSKSWYLRTGVKVGDLANFGYGALFAPIDADAAGIHQTGANHVVWTGSMIGGAAASDTCMNWTQDLGTGMAGDYTQAGTTWGTNASLACNQTARFYCFER